MAETARRMAIYAFACGDGGQIASPARGIAVAKVLANDRLNGVETLQSSVLNMRNRQSAKL